MPLSLGDVRAASRPALTTLKSCARPSPFERRDRATPNPTKSSCPACTRSWLAKRERSSRPTSVPVKFSRGRAALVAAAASVALVAGTAAATEALNQGRQAPVAVPAPHGQVLRTATFETPNHRAVGQIVAYRGNPSWVFMNVDVADYDGRIVCMLRSDSGSTVAAGAFELHDGVGQFSRTLRVDFGRLRGARLVTPGGSLVGSATFA